MPRILVIADDLTGAAEIGGIATRFGLSTQLLRTPAPPPTSCDVIVYDTNSRLLPTEAAAALTGDFAKAARAGAFDLVFKKTDSVLRGEPFVEINAVAERFSRSDILFVPQNPSRDRCITAGRYEIAGVPLHRTEFARDPLHPAKTSAVVELLRPTGGKAVRCIPLENQDSTGWVIGEATTVDDVAGWAERLDPERQLAAGGADFFEAIVRRSRRTQPTITPPVIERPLLYVSGTTSAVNADFRATLAAAGQLFPMPGDVFERGEAADIMPWVDDIVRTLKSHGTAMMAVGAQPGRVASGPEAIGRSLAAAAARAAQVGHVATIACEGGATAAALCEHVGWKRFTVEAEVAPGIVSLRINARGPRLIVKPGSYPWPRV